MIRVMFFTINPPVYVYWKQVISWRKGIRKLFRLPYRKHDYLVSGMVECISVKLDRRLIKCVHSMISSSNGTVSALIQVLLTCESSVFYREL